MTYSFFHGEYNTVPDGIILMVILINRPLTIDSTHYWSSYVSPYDNHTSDDTISPIVSPAPAVYRHVCGGEQD